MEKLWGGRFEKASSHLMEDFHSSITFDKKLYYWDIRGSQAHAKMLGEAGIISLEESKSLIFGLENILNEIEENKIEFTTYHEDIHMNIEVILTKQIGEVAKKLHTGRSRNDQVALDFKMYLRNAVTELINHYLKLVSTLVEIAQDHIDTIMPGYTHLQRAQPITFAHHLIAYIEMFLRDTNFLLDWLEQHNYMPLGSGALAGTTFPLNREYTADLLKFKAPTLNSLDSVGDRDFALDFLYLVSRSMMHLSRFSEEIILWNTQEFSFITLDDAYSTGSSIMPQKKNPDVAELVRGKTGRAFGNMISLLTVMKGLPLAYNKDMQEDKEAVFDSVDTLKKCLIIFEKMLSTMTINKSKMLSATKEGFVNATDLADYLTKKGLPFRDAHKVVGEMVHFCTLNHLTLDQLSLEQMKFFHTLIESDIYESISIHTCVNERNTYGGPSYLQVNNALIEIQKLIKQIKCIDIDYSLEKSFNL